MFDPGRVAYEAYSENRGGVAVDGDVLRGWDALPLELRSAWRVAGGAVLAAVSGGDGEGECGMTRDVSGLMEPEAADEAPAVSRGEVPGEVWRDDRVSNLERRLDLQRDGLHDIRRGLEAIQAEVAGIRTEMEGRFLAVEAYLKREKA